MQILRNFYMFFWIFPKTNIEQKKIFHYAVTVTHIISSKLVPFNGPKSIFLIDIP